MNTTKKNVTCMYNDCTIKIAPDTREYVSTNQITFGSTTFKKPLIKKNALLSDSAQPKIT